MTGLERRKGEAGVSQGRTFPTPSAQGVQVEGSGRRWEGLEQALWPPEQRSGQGEGRGRAWGGAPSLPGPRVAMALALWAPRVCAGCAELCAGCGTLGFL